MDNLYKIVVDDGMNIDYYVVKALNVNSAKKLMADSNIKPITAIYHILTGENNICFISNENRWPGA